MKRAATVLAISVILISGCVAKYAAPESGPTARMRFKVEGEHFWAAVFPLANENCDGKTSLGAIGGSAWRKLTDDNRPLGMLGSNEPDTKVLERIIPAEKRFVYQVNTIASGRRCYLTLNMLPRDGLQYETVITEDGAACHARVFKLIDNSPKNIGRVAETSARKNQKECKL